MSETFPERVARIEKDHNISFSQALRVALSERRFEERKAAIAEAGK